MERKNKLVYPRKAVGVGIERKNKLVYPTEVVGVGMERENKLIYPGGSRRRGYGEEKQACIPRES